MAREQIADVRITEGLKPQATPIDTYSRPAVPDTSAVTEIARSLAPLSSQLAQWGREQDAIKEEEAATRGQAAFYSNNQAGYEEATRKGLIPGYASKSYTDAYKSAEGAAAGRELDIKIGAAYEQWDKQFNDPQGFEKWIGPQIAGMIGTNDPAVLKGLMPHVRAAADKYQAQWMQDRAKDTEYRAVSAYGAAVGSTLDTYSRDGLTRQEGTDVAGAAATVEAIRESAYKGGIPTARVDKEMVDAIVSSAIKNEDPTLLKLLDGKSMGGTVLGDSPYGRAQKMEAINTLKTLYRQQDEVQRRKQEQIDKEVHNRALAVVTETLMKDPNATIPDEVVKTIEKRDGDFRVKLMEWRKSISEYGNREDERLLGQLYTDVMNGGGMDAVYTGITSQVLRKPESIAKAVSFAKDWDRFKDSPQAGILQDQMFKDIRTVIFTKGADTNALNPLQSERILTQSGRAALNDATQAAIQWAVQNPNATILERAKFLGSLQEVVAKSFVEGQGGDTKYARPDAFVDRFRDNPAAPPETQGPPSSAANRLPLPQRTITGEKPITPDQVGAPGTPERDMLEVRAKKLGVDPQMLLNKIWEREQRRKNGQEQMPQGASPTSMQPGGPGTDPVSTRPGAARLGGSPMEVVLPGGVKVSLSGIDPQAAAELGQQLTGLYQAITSQYRPPNTGSRSGGGASARVDNAAGPMPASIRNNNPGAQWPGAVASRFGSVEHEQLADGQGNKIARFKTPEDGAAAQFALLDSGYTGKPLLEAIKRWTGGNSSSQYAAVVSAATGIPMDAPITREMLRDPAMAIPLAKAMARIEAGRPFPMSDQQWATAHSKFLSTQ